MRKFLKYTLATIVGLIIFTLLGGMIMMGIFAGMVALSSETVDVKPNSVMTIDLTGVMNETSRDNVYAMLLDDDDPQMGLDKVLKSIKCAKTNNDIKGICLEPGAFSAGSASLREIRNALMDFRESGKFVVSYSGTYTQGGYYLSSVADKVYLNPQGSIALVGASSTPVFYKGLLEKLGVEMQVVKVGTYKSYCEQYTNTQMSDENREQTMALLGSLWETLVSEVAQSRGVSSESVNAAVDGFLPFMDQELVKNTGLVDGLLYKDEVETEMKAMMGLGKDDKLNKISYSDFVASVEDSELLEDNGDGDKKIEVVYAEGEIDNGNTGGISSSNMVKKLNKLLLDSTVKAVVIRVNSPGGSAYGSEQMWHAVTNLKQKKPVVVSMGDYAASGGYYLSCNADKIFAEPNTITGSIGIFGVLPNLEGLSSKVGITYDVVKTNKYSDFGDINRAMTADERAIMQAYVNRGYDLFLKRCADGRGLSVDSIGKIAQGRVWSGVDAKKIGLVDSIGDLNDAIAEAAQMAQVADYTVSYPKRKKWYEELLDMPSIGMNRIFGGSHFDKEIDVLKRAQSLDILQAALPYDMDVR